MKKLLILFLLLLTVPLTGCANLSDEYFPNETKNSMEEAMALFKTYSDHLENYYDEHYPKGVTDITEDERYIAVDTYKDTYSRDELLNYDLTDNRMFLVINEFEFVLYKLDEIYSFGVDECSKTPEGKLCKIEGLLDTDNAIMFQMEGTDIVLELIITSDIKVYTHTYYFRYEEDKVTLDYSFTTEVLSSSEITSYRNTYYKEDEVQKSYFKETGFDIEGKYLEYQEEYNLITGDFTRKHEGKDDCDLWYYNSSNNELYYIHKVNEDYEGFNYTVFNGKKEQIKYYSDRELYWVNFSEIPGWDYLVRKDNSSYFEMYLNNEIPEGLTVAIQFRYGEYVYGEFSKEELTDDVLNLSKFGLSLPYSNQFFADKESFIIDNFNTILEDAGMELPGMDAVATE